MTDAMILLTPLLVLLVLAVVSFTGCGKYLPPSEDPIELPDDPNDPKNPKTPSVVTAPGTTPPYIKPPTYIEIVENAPGFAALWPLNETGGNVANVVGLNPADGNGTYTVGGGAPAGSRYKVGQDGVLYHKDTSDHAPLFEGTPVDGAFVQVPFNGPLNPVKTVNGFTVELWVKPNPAAAGDTQVLVSSHRFDAANNQQGYEIALIRNPAQPLQNQQVRCRVFANGTMSQAIAQPLQGDPAEWRHIVFIWQLAAIPASTVTIQVRLAKSAGPFKDGPHAAPYESVTSTRPSTLRFGAGHGVSQVPVNYFAGWIDNVAFYNSILPQAEIDKHFNMF